MQRQHQVTFTLDAATGEAAGGAVYLDGVEYYLSAVPADRVRRLRGSVGSVHLGAVNLGPLSAQPNRCPLCGK